MRDSGFKRKKILFYLDSNPRPSPQPPPPPPKKKTTEITAHSTCRKSSAFDHSASGSLKAERAVNYLYYPTLIHIYMYFTLGTFRHMRVPRDTSVLREIIIVYKKLVGNCQTL